MSQAGGDAAALAFLEARRWLWSCAAQLLRAVHLQISHARKG